MAKKIFLSAVTLLSCLAAQEVFAISAVVQPRNQAPIDIQEFQLQPRLSLWGLTGNSTLAEGQFLVPLYGDRTRALYTIVEGNIVNNDSSWLGGVGFGYRQVFSERIYGGYALADYIGTTQNGFVVINPGVEMLGNVWDINVNGYIPLDNRRKLGKEGWAGDDFGDYSHTRPTGHDFYDHRIQEYEEPGRGLDFEVARVIPHFEDAKLHVGAYHFDTSDFGSINGVEARLTYILNKYTGIELQESCDNVKHNQLLAGVRFTLGDYSKEEKKKFGIASRLLDPIEHNRINSGLLLVKDIDQGERKEHDNVWYFKQLNKKGKNGSAKDTGPQQGSGTAEDPFIGFTPGNYGAINPNMGTIDKYPLMFFAPGSYNFGGFNTAPRFDLPNGWGMYGKTADYKSPAMGDERATFTGGLDLKYNAGEGNAPTTLNSIRILNDQGATSPSDHSSAALYVENAGNVILQNTDIQNNVVAPSSPEPTVMYVYGIYAKNSTINFESLNRATAGVNSVVVLSDQSKDDGRVVYATGSTINFDGGKNVITGMSKKGFAINADHSTVNFNGGENTIAIAGTLTEVFGIYASHSLINFNGGENAITGSIEHGNGYGIDAYYSTINFNGGRNVIAGVGAGDQFESSYGIQVSNSTINFNGGENTITGRATGDDNISAYGISAYSSTINFANSSSQKVTIGAVGTTKQYGIMANEDSHIQRYGRDLSNGTSLSDMQKYINFNGSGDGAAVQWDSHFILNWP